MMSYISSLSLSTNILLSKSKSEEYRLKFVQIFVQVENSILERHVYFEFFIFGAKVWDGVSSFYK